MQQDITSSVVPLRTDLVEFSSGDATGRVFVTVLHFHYVGGTRMCPREQTVRRSTEMLIDVGQTTTRWRNSEQHSRHSWLWYCVGRGEPTGSAERRFLSNGAQKVSRPETISGRKLVVDHTKKRRVYRREAPTSTHPSQGVRSRYI